MVIFAHLTYMGKQKMQKKHPNPTINPNPKPTIDKAPKQKELN